MNNESQQRNFNIYHSIYNKNNNNQQNTNSKHQNHDEENSSISSFSKYETTEQQNSHLRSSSPPFLGTPQNLNAIFNSHNHNNNVHPQNSNLMFPSSFSPQHQNMSNYQHQNQNHDQQPSHLQPSPLSSSSTQPNLQSPIAPIGSLPPPSHSSETPSASSSNYLHSTQSSSPSPPSPLPPPSSASYPHPHPWWGMVPSPPPPPPRQYQHQQNLQLNHSNTYNHSFSPQSQPMFIPPSSSSISSSATSQPSPVSPNFTQNQHSNTQQYQQQHQTSSYNPMNHNNMMFHFLSPQHQHQPHPTQSPPPPPPPSSPPMMPFPSPSPSPTPPPVPSAEHPYPSPRRPMERMSPHAMMSAETLEKQLTDQSEMNSLSKYNIGRNQQQKQGEKLKNQNLNNNNNNNNEKGAKDVAEIENDIKSLLFDSKNQQSEQNSTSDLKHKKQKKVGIKTKKDEEKQKEENDSNNTTTTSQQPEAKQEANKPHEKEKQTDQRNNGRKRFKPRQNATIQINLFHDLVKQLTSRINKKNIRFPAEFEQRLQTQSMQLYKRLVPPESEHQHNLEFFEAISKTIRQRFSDAQIYMFGSSANRLSIKGSSDIDICVHIQDAQDIPELVKLHAQLFEAEGMKDVVSLVNARVPIVKFTDPNFNIQCDLGINNMLAVYNTRLIHEYTKIDPRLRQMAFIIKYWSKRRDINQPYHGTLSSYGYVMLIIYYLQRRNPQILPNLQALKRSKSTKTVRVDGYDCTHDNGQQWVNFGKKNHSSLAMLLTGFFKFYGMEFDYQRSVVSIRCSKRISKKDKNWDDLSEQRNYFCIEDPFETDFNVGRTVSFDGLATIRYYMLWAYNSLCEGANLKDICA